MEFAVLIAAIAGALIGMHIYLKRGLSGNYREAADQMGEQYSPGETTSTFTVATWGTTHVKSWQNSDGGIDKIITESRIDPGDPERTTRTGSETVNPLADEDLWD